MSKWRYTKGLKDIGNCVWAYLLPDGSSGWSNEAHRRWKSETLLVDTLFDLKLTAEMLAEHAALHAGRRAHLIRSSTHHNGDHTFGNQLVDGAEIVATKRRSTKWTPHIPRSTTR